MKQSQCCGARVDDDTDMCMDCKEHCDVEEEVEEEATLQTYEAVARARGLDAPTARRFVAYMTARWPAHEPRHCQVGYAQEWAARFRAGVEYAASDEVGQAILRQGGRP